MRNRAKRSHRPQPPTCSLDGLAPVVVVTELERTNVPCPAVLAAVFEIDGVDSVFIPSGRTLVF